MDAGADDPGYLTDLVEGWRSRCLQGQVPSVELCAALAQAEDDEAERLAFELNLAASEGGTFPPDLAALHFTHGPYTGWSVADLARAFEDPNRDPLELIDLARAVNRAFVGGHDAGVLARWVATPLCGAREVAYGPERARCALLDTECTRGRFVASHGCCIADLAPAGAVCEGGVCGERGTCVRERELRSTARVRGRLAHFELLSGGGSPWPWHVSDSSAIRIARVDDPGPSGLAGPEARSRVASAATTPSSARSDSGAPAIGSARSSAAPTRTARRPACDASGAPAFTPRSSVPRAGLRSTAVRASTHAGRRDSSLVRRHARAGDAPMGACAPSTSTASSPIRRGSTPAPARIPGRAPRARRASPGCRASIAACTPVAIPTTPSRAASADRACRIPRRPRSSCVGSGDRLRGASRA